MKPYLISIAVGILVGLIYAALNVRSPAPPAFALLGLLGILLGEQALPIATRILRGEPVRACMQVDCGEQDPASQARAGPMERT